MLRQSRRFPQIGLKAVLLAVGLLLGVLVATGSPAGASGFSWSIVSTPNTSPSEINVLNAVTCVSTSDCWAVGQGNMGPGGPNNNAHALAEHWNGTAWSIVTTPSAGLNLNGVSCVSSADCWAVGNGSGSMLADHWNGSTWSSVATPGSGALIYGISCAGTSDCWVVGQGSNGMAVQTFAEHWNGTAWSIVSLPNTSPSLNNELFGVTCVNTSDCWAVGGQTAIREQALTEHWNGSAWSIVLGTLRSQLNRVTCVSSSDCWAVGIRPQRGSKPESALAEHWNGTAWSVVRTRDLPGAGDGFDGVSCSSSSDCWAVGGGGLPLPGQSLAEHWDGRRWSLVAAPANGLAAVFCISSADCWAVGAVSGSGTLPQTLAEHGT